MTYFPPAGDDAWERVSPAAAGLSADGVAAAVAHAKAHDSPWVYNLQEHLEAGHFEPPPWNEIIGPTRGRGGPAGVILSGGRIVAEWGMPWRPDMTFSIAKSFISLCVGLAHDDGLIPDLDAPVHDLVKDGGFDSDQNATITWRMLLQLTSEWEGALWGKAGTRRRARRGRCKPPVRCGNTTTCASTG